MDVWMLACNFFVFFTLIEYCYAQVRCEKIKFCCKNKIALQKIKFRNQKILIRKKQRATSSLVHSTNIKMALGRVSYWLRNIHQSEERHQYEIPTKRYRWRLRSRMVMPEIIWTIVYSRNVFNFNFRTIQKPLLT